MKESSLFLLLKHNQEVILKFLIPQGKDTITIGRKGFSADIEIDSPNVSRLHATIFIQEGNTLSIQDQMSTNGTYKNGQVIRESDLETGDVITFQKNTPEFILLINAEEAHANSRADSKPIPLGEMMDTPLSLYNLLQNQRSITIGRHDCDITLPNLTISRKHTIITRQDEGVFLVQDLGSKNGTFVNGELIRSATEVREGDVIQVGKYEFKLSKDTDTQNYDTSPQDVIVAQSLTRLVGNGDKKKKILREVNLNVKAGDIVAIMGPSGSGKSTLLKALNGYAPATQGRVFIHGRDFYKNYKLLKQDIGYVPQDDIVHAKLRVYDALYYAARLRLAADVSAQEINQKIDEILKKLAIESIKFSLIQNISGGQRKRVSIAVELLSDPSILFLDEPTSPLDPETVEEFLDILRKLSQSGTTILMVTHKPDDLDSVDKIIFLSKGGYLVFYGDTQDYLRFFEAKNVIGVYANINDLQKGKHWAKRFKDHSSQESRVFKANEKIVQPSKQSAFRQLFWLTSRYFKIKTNDRVNTLILILQAPIIAGLLALLFEKLMVQTLFLIIISAVWLGTSNAAREIVGELSVYRRERMFNLRIFPYILSKIIVINFFSLIQVLLIIGIIYISVGISHFWSHIGILFLISFTGVLLGLLLSATADNADKVMSIVPLVLLPQIMLAGVIQRIQTNNEWMSYLTVSRWGIEAAANIEEDAYFYYPDTIPNTTYFEALKDISPLDTVRRQEVEDSLAVWEVPDSLYGYVEENILGNANMLEFPTYYSIEESLLVIAGQALLLLTFIYVGLRRKDRL